MITSTSNKIVYVNSEFEKISGFTKSDAIGKTAAIL